MSPQNDNQRWGEQAEGQFFDRKSAFDRSGRKPRRRKATEIAKDIAETLSAMANADGGELVIGIEDDGEITGIPHPDNKVRLFLGVPADRNYVEPPLKASAEQTTTNDGLLILRFQTDWSPEVHHLADGRYLLRINDTNQPFPAEEIAALKAAKGQALFERAFPPGASFADLNLDLVQGKLSELSSDKHAEEVLRAYGLVADRNGRSVPNMAGVLLFGRQPTQWHPRCGIEFVRWEGIERKHGADLNVIKRYRIEEPLAILIEKAYETVRPFIRERQQLYDLFFTERLEYPTFVWQEAIVNAVAHRDYSIQGACVEVHMFDDRIEVHSPGLPPPPVTVAALSLRKPIHVSRNPLIVRVLTDLGYMRDLGEGIPRMFEEMEREGFYPPEFEGVSGMSFQVTVRNEPIYDRGTMQWLSRFEETDLTGDQKRLLAYAHAHGGRFTSRDYQKLAGLDIHGASKSIKDLMRKGLVRSTAKGSRVYEVLEPLESMDDMPAELVVLLPLLSKGAVTNRDIRHALKVDRQTALRTARRLVDEGWLRKEGRRRWTRYIFAKSLRTISRI